MGSGFLGGISFLAFVAYAIAQFVAGFVGIEHHLGLVWACLALVAALGLRFTLPITIGAFFGAMNVWGWHWFFAAIFVAPGLVVMIPGVLVAISVAARKAFSAE